MRFDESIIKTSKRNFQIELQNDNIIKDDKVIISFGKKEKRKYILDFRSPINIMQAFAVSLTSMYWK